MRQYFIDELSADDILKIKQRLGEWAEESEVNGLYWMEISEDNLTSEQKAASQDHPFCFAVEIGEAWVKFEMLIRSRSNFRSLHIGYADKPQQIYIIDFADRLIRELQIST